MKRVFLVVLLFLLSVSFVYPQSKIDSINKLVISLSDTDKVKKLNEIYLEYKFNDAEFSTEIAKLAYFYANKSEIDTFSMQPLLNIAFSYSYTNLYDSVNFYLKLLDNICLNEDYSEHKNAIDFYAQSFNLKGITEYMQSNFEKAIEYYLEAEKKFIEIENFAGAAKVYNNIAIIYRKMENYNKALDYYMKSLDANTIIKDTTNIAITCNNISIIYGLNGDTLSFLRYLSIAIKFNKEKNNFRGLANNYHTLGNHYLRVKNYKKAIVFLNKSLILKKKVKSDKNLGVSYNSLTECYILLKDIPKAKLYLDSSLQIYNKFKDIEIYAFCLGSIYRLDSLKGNFKDAFFTYLEFKRLNDSLYKDETENKISELQTKYLTEKKDKEIKIKDLEIAKNDEKIKKQNTLIVSFIVGFIIVLFSTLLIIRQNRRIRMANQMLAERNAEIKQQNEEILSQRDELKIKNDKIETQNRDIIASINYAARIQKVLITQKDILNKLLPQNMLFFKPRNIVSGDFYWAKEISKTKIAFAAADCTGHGVPGALMSVLGVTYLNETVNDLIEELGVDNVLASSVLDLMRDRIKNMLNQEDLDSETKDGMDMAFCIIDYEKMQLDFAGANNPIFLIRKIGDNYELTEYKADKMPIGISFSKKRNFLNHKIDIQKNDIIYCFSDGIVDQFGGDNNQKYYKANFKKFLLTIQNLNLENQKIAIKKELENWMQFKYDQTDDILVLAVKI